MGAVCVLLHDCVVLVNSGGHQRAVAVGVRRTVHHEKVDLDPHCCADD